MIAQALAGKKIILASKSPRRQEILSRLVLFNLGLETNFIKNIPFQIVGSEFQENLSKSNYANCKDYVMDTARAKGLEVAARSEFDVLISADTIIELYASSAHGCLTLRDGAILEKPTTTEHAREMLRAMSDKWHSVHTACFVVANSKKYEFVETTRVKFLPLSEQQIEWYVASGECMDKAGAYGYQGLGMLLVEKIDGCYYNVVGFPISRLMGVISSPE